MSQWAKNSLLSTSTGSPRPKREGTKSVKQHHHHLLLLLLSCLFEQDSPPSAQGACESLCRVESPLDLLESLRPPLAPCRHPRLGSRREPAICWVRGWIFKFQISNSAIHAPQSALKRPANRRALRTRASDPRRSTGGASAGPLLRCHRLSRCCRVSGADRAAQVLIITIFDGEDTRSTSTQLYKSIGLPRSVLLEIRG